MTASDIDSQAACLVLEDFYQAKGRNAEVIYPDEGIEPLKRRSATAEDGTSSSPGLKAKPNVAKSFDVSYDSGPFLSVL